jgi:hypothetical protein
MKEASVDCSLNVNHNKLMSSYKCFQFDEQSLFNETIGPAYKEDIYDDMKYNNGLNAPNYKVTRIKINKIKAVKQIKNDNNSENTKNIYSEPENYWYNPNTNIVYDYDLQFPIGKVGVDDDNIPLKLDNETFIINKTIPIPIIKQ